ncbi:hypothetical protein RZR97_05450 [Hydrogenimonas thermophila]|uniref:hypothetical protein n=1 Tax=Hydrogenimonas thermophila TaxID=223786 RepID=UPI002937362D|nr:hypothetical protein [Hydrogenimonas thermophila]WOE71021.1 hypothetical protein RZR91_05470 [Hydrogenimonas thermophila]WOE73539.1 hypothetical protein RZR97_05450 [Hydrogenimonas thermophila]
MIYGLNPINATKALLSKLSAIEVNALLQVGIKVLKKEGKNSFLIQLGRHKFTTKSNTALENGREYWIQMSQTKEGIIQLKHLHPKPLLLQKFLPLEYNHDFFKSISEKSKSIENIKNQIMQTMAATNNKDEFATLTQMLLSLHNGVFTIPIIENGKKMLLQMRKGKQKNREFNKDSIEFYAAMNNLGPIEGEITLLNGSKHLKLKLFYPRSIGLLKKYSNRLEGFSSINIIQADTPVLPFWDGVNLVSLLDIKG